jgi:hypothetical protein
MGLFDLPAPVLTWLDARLAAVLPAVWRRALWGVVTGVFSMGLYALLSPQKRLGEAKRRLAASKVALDQFDGEFQDAFPLMRTMLGQALRQIVLTIGPALVAMAPVLCLIAWLSTAYGYRFPESLAEIDVSALPASFSAVLAAAPPTADDPRPRLQITDASGQLAHEQVLNAPVTTLHPRQWWSALIGNPAGYLPEALGVERVAIDLPRQRYLPFGPAWLRGWEAVFFVALSIAALAIKIGFRIH